MSYLWTDPFSGERELIDESCYGDGGVTLETIAAINKREHPELLISTKHTLIRMMRQQMEITTPSTDCLRTLANHYRKLAGEEFAIGMDQQATKYRNAAAQIEQLYRELPKLPEPKVVTP